MMLTAIKYITAIIQQCWIDKINNDLYLSENVWNTTTGRQLTWIDGGIRNVIYVDDAE